jgi:predicted chitinase
VLGCASLDNQSMKCLHAVIAGIAHPLHFSFQNVIRPWIERLIEGCTGVPTGNQPPQQAYVRYTGRFLNGQRNGPGSLVYPGRSSSAVDRHTVKSTLDYFLTLENT